MSIEVLEPGLQTTVQDLGRNGWRHLGVGASGAADSIALRTANALVRNAPGAAGLEITLSGPRLRFTKGALIALCGADIAAELVDDRGTRSVPMRRPRRISAGQELRLGACTRGARTYLAVAGGIAIAEMLGSRSTDLTARLCGRALRAGDVLPLFPSENLFESSFFVREDPHHDEAAFVLRILLGTHGERGIDALTQSDWRVAADTSRMGVRLSGPRLAAASTTEMISEPVTPGTVQLPPSGAPIILGVEAPTTGGYPRIAHVITADLPRLHQLRPGDAVHFRRVDENEARSARFAQEQRLALLTLAVQTKKEFAT